MNKLAKRREELEREIEEKANEIKEYFLENTGLYAKVKLGDTNHTMRHTVYSNTRKEYVNTDMSDVDIVKNEIKIKKIINEINVKSIKEMREALDEANV